MSIQKKTEIEEILKTSLRDKFARYQPETVSMPFHTRLLGKDRLALYSFIHSLNTNFGTAIFEPVAQVLAQERFPSVNTQCVVGTQISLDAQAVIQTIIDALTTASAQPNKSNEIARIKHVCQSGEMRQVKLTRVDLKVETATGEIFLFDIKTAKPNAGNFKEFKRTLLEWAAATLAQNPEANVHSLIAIPYNPYEPEPYARWTMRGMLDLDNELKVGNEFWNFIAGGDVYNELLECFEHVGLEMRDEIDEYFDNFAHPNTTS